MLNKFRAAKILCGVLCLTSFVIGCATTSTISPAALEAQRQQEAAFEAYQPVVASNVAHYPQLTKFGQPSAEGNSGFRVPVFGYGAGVRDQGERNDFNGLYRSWQNWGDDCTHFSLVLTWNNKGIRQHCQGKIFGNVVYEFRAESHEAGKNTETTTNSNSYLGQSLLQVCTRAADFALRVMAQNPRLFRYGY